MVGITRNIEERKKMELEVLQSREGLRKANSTKDKFFSIIAHDLKNPIASLLRVCEVLVDDYKENKVEDMGEYIEMLHNASNQTYKLLENLLT